MKSDLIKQPARPTKAANDDDGGGNGGWLAGRAERLPLPHSANDRLKKNSSLPPRNRVETERSNVQCPQLVREVADDARG